MADVSRVRDGDRGQLLLVAALVMAVSFVAIALTLNTAIYTENRATRSSDIAGGSAAIQFERATTDAAGDLLEHANAAHNRSHEALTSNLTGGIERWSNVSGKVYALTGDVVELRNVEVTNGSKLTQNVTRNFTAADGTVTWTLASNVNDTRTFEVNVSRASLVDSSKLLIRTGVDTVFNVHLQDDTGDHWRIHVYKNVSVPPNTVNVTVEKPDGTFTTPCSTTADPAVLNLTAGTLGGDDCPEVAFLDDLVDPYAITYNDTDTSPLTSTGDTAEGTYEVTLDNASVATGPAPYFNDGPGADSPQAAPTAFAVEFDAIYETSRTRYNATVRVTGGAG